MLYVDYGSLETVKKSDIRLLSTQFSKLPIQSLHCTLYECDKLNVPREINIYFADLIENKKLEAKFHKMSSNVLNFLSFLFNRNIILFYFILGHK